MGRFFPRFCQAMMKARKWREKPFAVIEYNSRVKTQRRLLSDAALSSLTY